MMKATLHAECLTHAQVQADGRCVFQLYGKRAADRHIELRGSAAFLGLLTKLAWRQAMPSCA